MGTIDTFLLELRAHMIAQELREKVVAMGKREIPLRKLEPLIDVSVNWVIRHQNILAEHGLNLRKVPNGSRKVWVLEVVE